MGVIHSRAKHSAKAQAGYTRHQLRQQTANQQARPVYPEHQQQQAQHPATLNIVTGLVYLTPRSNPLVLSPAEARWLGRELIGAADMAERGRV